MTLRGDLAEFDVLQLLRLMDLTSKTGALHLEGPEESVTLYFKDGRMIRANGSAVEPLDQRLLRAGRLAPQQAKEAVVPGTTSEKAIGFALVDSGVISQEEITRFVESETRSRILRALISDQGSFTFAPGALPPEDEITTLIELKPVIEEGRNRLEEWRGLVSRIPSLDVATLVVENPPAEAGRVSLSLQEWQVATNVAQGRTLRSVAQRLALDEFQIRQVVTALIERGLVEVQPGAPEPQEEAPSPAEAAVVSPPPRRKGFRLFG